MKNSVLILIVAWLFLSACCFSDDKYNFTYSDGDKPWLNHIPSEINTTYEAALKEFPYLKRIVCAGDSTDIGKHPFSKISEISPICLQGGGAKMVVPRANFSVDHYIFLSPLEGGLFEQEHMARGLNLDYYQPSGPLMTIYFLVEFDGYEIPTCFPKETNELLPLWRRLLLKRNDMSREYFDAHIRVVSTSVEMREWKGKPDRRFIINYYFCVDWARILLSDCVCINQDYDEIEELTTQLMQSEDIHNPGLWSARDRLGLGLSVTRIASIDHIAGKDEVRRAVSEASPLLVFDVNKSLTFRSDGRMLLRLHGIVEESQNKCLRATIDLENAQVSDIESTPCRIY